MVATPGSDPSANIWREVKLSNAEKRVENEGQPLRRFSAQEFIVASVPLEQVPGERKAPKP
jgi:hypothetical protein